MQLGIIGGFGGELPACRSTTFLIDGILALDAGSLSSGLSLEQQLSLAHIALSHSHADHCASLTYFAENVFGSGQTPVRIYCSPFVVEALRAHMFNNILWPNMASPRLPVLELIPVEPGEPFQVEHLTITPVEVPHTVPCLGFHVDDGHTGLLYAADMGPNDGIWDFANRVPRLDAVLLECSFPNRLQELARKSQHLTPQDVDRELAKLRRPTQVLIYHIKPPHWDEVVRELGQLERSLTILRQDARLTLGSG